MAETHAPWTNQQLWSEVDLAEIFQQVLRDGRSAVVSDSAFLSLFGLAGERLSVGEVWQSLVDRLIPEQSEAYGPLQIILQA